jgi:hypothetical protein
MSKIKPERKIGTGDECGEDESQQIANIHTESPFYKPNSIVGAEPEKGKIGKKVKLALKGDIG